MKGRSSLTAIGVILFLWGLAGIVLDCAQNHGFALAPSTNLFNIIAGVGLLKYWRMARWYSIFVFGAGLFFGLPMTVWAAFNSNKILFQFPNVLIDDRPHAVAPLFLVMLVLLAYVVVSGWAYVVLMQTDVREMFQRKTGLSEAPAAS